MKRREIILLNSARQDMASITRMLIANASAEVAHRYINRIVGRINTLASAAERGTVRNRKTKLRVIGLLPSITVAFAVDEDTVVVHRVLYHGRDFRPED